MPTARSPSGRAFTFGHLGDRLRPASGRKIAPTASAREMEFVSSETFGPGLLDWCPEWPISRSETANPPRNPRKCRGPARPWISCYFAGTGWSNIVGSNFRPQHDAIWIWDRATPSSREMGKCRPKTFGGQKAQTPEIRGNSSSQTRKSGTKPLKTRRLLTWWKFRIFHRTVWWAIQGSNLWPLPCEGSALPLS
jgi:hypothetical protein